MTDTHAHLDACDEPPEALLERASDAGVTRVVTIGTGIASCLRALEIAAAFPGVHAALGIDPHQAASPEAAQIGELRDLLARDGVVAVGETGLDAHYGGDTLDQQRRLFEDQLALATEAGLPVVIHCRAAAAETAAVLAAHGGEVILHCFSEPDLLGPALANGWYVSFAGNVTYPTADALRAAAEAVPEDRLLVETDSPYLSPQPVRGRRNEPAHLVHTVDCLARVRGVDPRALAARLHANAAAAFRLP